MTLGILHPPGEHDERPFAECPRLYFSEAFLSGPPTWCEVGLPAEEEAHAWLATMREWDDEAHHTLLSMGYEAVRRNYQDYSGWFLWPKGTKVTHQFPAHRKTIWVLTGIYFPLTASTMYEGKWPD